MCVSIGAISDIRRLYPQGEDSNRIKKSDKELVKTSDYTNIQFPVTCESERASIFRLVEV